MVLKSIKRETLRIKCDWKTHRHHKRYENTFNSTVVSRDVKQNNKKLYITINLQIFLLNTKNKI